MRSMRFATSSCCVAAASISLFLSVSTAGGQAIASAKSAIVPTKSIVSLDPLTNEEASARSMVELTKTLQHPLENFREFEAVGKGQVGDAKILTLRFAAGAKLLTIKSTPDFKVEQGGSCVEGYSYALNSTCTLLVRSTPQGPGHRLGKLTITNSADATPLYVGIGGYGNSPTISFTPSIITTVPGTFASNAGTISAATNIAVDGGDNLYIADTGNNAVKYIDSSGKISSLSAAFGTGAPISILVDRTGYIYFTRQAQYYFMNILTGGGAETAYGSGSTACATGSTCNLGSVPVNYSKVGQLALDPGGNIFLNTFQSAARIVTTTYPDGYIPLYVDYPYNNDFPNTPQPLAVDGSDTLYSYSNHGNPKACNIYGVSYYNAANMITSPVAVAGTQTCGFSGDGGQARGAQIGTSVGQMVFDIAGNFYFSDTTNQRVRRIDGATGIITTIAGNGSVGYSGDNHGGPSATLRNPTGVAVDSQGQVYILSSSASSGSAQVVRKVGVVGALDLGSIAVGSSSTAGTVQLSNTGNSQLDFAHVGFSSGNTTDFTMDPNTTSCVFTAPLASGRSCKIGFIFKPSATGTRSAVLSITDDTIASVNTIQLSGTGSTTATLTPSSLTFPSVTVGANSASQKATLTNTGKATMTISSVLISGTSATSFADTTTCGTTLAVGASCTITITFKPTSAGTRTATLTVSDNALGGKQTVALTGTGVATAVKKVATQTTLVSLANPTLMHSPLVLTAKVSGATQAISAGKVQLWEGDRLWSEVALKEGVATFTLSQMERGPHMMRAVYAGDSKVLASESAPVRQMVISPVLSPIARTTPIPSR